MTDYTSNPYGKKIDWGTSEVESGSAGDLPVFGASGVPTLLSSATEGDLYTVNSSGVNVRLGVGNNGEVLVVSNGAPAWQTGTGLNPPIGSVLAWLKSFTNTPALPDGWVEMNGQTLSDAESVYDGQTIPNLNGATAGTQRLLRGATTSGTTGQIAVSGTTGQTCPAAGNGSSGCHTHSFSANASAGDYYEVVWVMRVK